MTGFLRFVQTLLICAGLAVAAAGQEAQPTTTSPSDFPKTSSESAHPVASPGDKATLYVYRHRRFEGAALKPSLYVDDREMARVENGRYFIVKLEPGRHSIRSNDKASGVDVSMMPGETYYVRVDMQTGLWKGHGRLTLILPEQGEYEVRQTRPLNDADVRDRELVVLSMRQP